MLYPVIRQYSNTLYDLTKSGICWHQVHTAMHGLPAEDLCHSHCISSHFELHHLSMSSHAMSVKSCKHYVPMQYGSYSYLDTNVKVTLDLSQCIRT